MNTYTKSSTYSENAVINEFLISDEFQTQIPPNYIKVLGCICYTTAGQILFYPSFPTDYLTKFKNMDKPEKDLRNITIDHFTLEPSFKKWHVTYSTCNSKDQKLHLRGLNTQKIDDNIINWFGMSINSEVKFEQAYRINSFSYLYPVSDGERRIQDIASSIKYRDDCLITAPIIDEYSDKDSFYHFEFYIKIDSSIPSKNLDLYPPNPNALQIPISGKIRFIAYDINIPNFKGKLEIVATMSRSVYFSSLGRFTFPNFCGLKFLT